MNKKFCFAYTTLVQDAEIKSSTVAATQCTSLLPGLALVSSLKTMCICGSWRTVIVLCLPQKGYHVTIGDGKVHYISVFQSAFQKCSIPFFFHLFPFSPQCEVVVPNCSPLLPIQLPCKMD